MKKYLILAALSVLALRSEAQNLNPKVQVENDYSATFDSAVRNGVAMSVPDSLLSFDYKFDYEVFTSPYKGAYDVSQFRMQNIPSRSVSDAGKFYLNMGAGYNFRPEMQLAWEPFRLGAYSLSLNNDFDGFLGQYTKGEGYEFREGLSLGNRWALNPCTIDFKLGYDGVFSKITDAHFGQSAFNSGYADFSLGSITPDAGSSLYYKAGLSYRFAQDRLGDISERENLFCLAASIGPEISGTYLALIDLNVDMDMLGGQFGQSTMHYSLTPHCIFPAGPVNLDLGFRLSYTDGVRIFPAVKASVSLLRDYLAVFAEISGDEYLNSYTGFKKSFAFYNPGFGLPSVYRDKFNAGLGFRGHAAGCFQYEVKASWADKDGAPLETAGFRMAAADFKLLTTEAKLAWSSDRVDANLHFLYRYSWMSESAEALKVFRLPDFYLDGRFVYNWRKRVYAGLDCRWQSARRIAGADGSAPSFVDLGILGEYRIDNVWKVWLKGGNLLGGELWLNPYFAQKGLSATVGFSLNF